MRPRLAGLGIGVVFGVTLSWSGMTSPVVIRQALLFQKAYLFLFFASAVLVATVGLLILRRRRTRALITKQPVTWNRESIGRRHIVGSMLFGLGWGITDACPGPIVTQVGQGIVWGAWTLMGAIAGVYVYLRRDQPETEPAVEHAVTTMALDGSRSSA